jgi:protein-tyrosine phosphatase
MLGVAEVLATIVVLLLTAFCLLRCFLRVGEGAHDDQIPEDIISAYCRALGISHDECKRMLHEAQSPEPSAIAARPRLYLGNALASKDLPTLRRHGVTHILNATSNLPCHYPSSMTYLRVPVEDALSADLAAHFERSSDFISAALRDGMGGAVLVHCQQGVSRSATLVIAFLMREHGWRMRDALAHVEKCRWVHPNEAFVAQLRRYEGMLDRK